MARTHASDPSEKKWSGALGIGKGVTRFEDLLKWFDQEEDESSISTKTNTTHTTIFQKKKLLPATDPVEAELQAFRESGSSDPIFFFEQNHCSLQVIFHCLVALGQVDTLWRAYFMYFCAPSSCSLRHGLLPFAGLLQRAYIQYHHISSLEVLYRVVTCLRYLLTPGEHFDQVLSCLKDKYFGCDCATCSSLLFPDHLKSPSPHFFTSSSNSTGSSERRDQFVSPIPFPVLSKMIVEDQIHQE